MFGAHRVGEFSRFRQATFLYRFIINKILISQSKHLYCYRNLRNASLLFFTCDSNQLHDKGIVEQYVLITDVNNFGNVLKTFLCRSMTWTFSVSTYCLVYGVSFFCFSLRIMRFLFSLLFFWKWPKQWSVPLISGLSFSLFQNFLRCFLVVAQKREQRILPLKRWKE